MTFRGGRAEGGYRGQPEGSPGSVESSAGDSGVASHRVGLPVAGGASVMTLVKERNRRLLLTTNTLENAIAAPASIGLSRPKAANGSAATL